MAADRPTPEFGKRRPAPIPTAQPVKRSNHVALLLMGSFAVGGSALALMPGQKCAANPPGVASGAPANAACSPGGSSSGGHGGSWSRSGFFSSDSSSGRSGILSGVSRGGFGSFAGGFSRGG